MNLRTRITLLTLLILSLSLLVIGASVYALLQRYLYQTLRAELRDAVSQVVNQNDIPFPAGNSAELLNKALPPSVYGEVDILIPDQPTPESFVNNFEVIPIPSRTLGGQRMLLTPNDYATLLQKGEVWTIAQLPQADGQPQRLLVHGVLVRGRNAPLNLRDTWLAVLVAKPLRPIELTLAELSRVYLFVSILVLTLVGVLTYVLVGRTLEPLEAIAHKAEEVSIKGWTRLPEPDTNDEVAAVARALNRMLDRLEHAFQTQTRFLADASHELRTPITAILGHVGYLLRRTPVTEKQRESLETIRREGERMTKLVTDLLDLAGSEGGWRFDIRPVELRELLEEIAAEYGRTFEGSIALEAPEDEVWVEADDQRLHQVFANLVANAIKAGARRVELRVRLPGDRVVVQVVDDGPGIPPEHLPHLFERFYRVDKARDRAAGGSGLGLAIVKAIVEALGGEVWVESEVGRGTTFSVSLKRAKARPPRQR
ncbi:sensor histidine kinase [Oceanithermus sp.]